MTLIHDRLAELRRTLEWRHLAPSAPDSLECYPFDKETGDPMLIEECPHVLFASNQPSYKSEMISLPTGQNVLLLLVPDFSTTSTAVIVNIDTLETHPIIFK